MSLYPNERGGWVVVLATTSFIFLLFLPLWNSGICINDGAQKETVGVCTRQWLQGIGPIIIGLVTLYISYLAYRFTENHTKRQEILNHRRIIHNEMQVLGEIRSEIRKIEISILSSSQVLEKSPKIPEVCLELFKLIVGQLKSSESVRYNYKNTDFIFEYPILIANRNYICSCINVIYSRSERYENDVSGKKGLDLDVLNEFMKETSSEINDIYRSIAQSVEYCRDSRGGQIDFPYEPNW